MKSTNNMDIRSYFGIKKNNTPTSTQGSQQNTTPLSQNQRPEANENQSDKRRKAVEYQFVL